MRAMRSAMTVYGVSRAVVRCDGRRGRVRRSGSKVIGVPLVRGDARRVDDDDGGAVTALAEIDADEEFAPEDVGDDVWATERADFGV